MKCVVCGKNANDILEYKSAASIEGYNSGEDFVRECEGTYNAKEDIFCCTDCYIEIGMPLGVATKKWATRR